MSSTEIIIVVDKQVSKEEQEKEVKRMLFGLWTEFQIKNVEELHGKSFISVVCKRPRPAWVA